MSEFDYPFKKLIRLRHNINWEAVVFILGLLAVFIGAWFTK